MIEQLVEQIESRWTELQSLMSDPEVIGDRQRFAEAGRAYSELEPAAQLAVEWRRAQDDAAGARELLAEDEDPELREVLTDAEATMERLEEDLRLAMVERDPNDDKDVIIEIRPGVGGDEAGLWAGVVGVLVQQFTGAGRVIGDPLVFGGQLGRRLELPVGARRSGEFHTISKHDGIGKLGLELTEAGQDVLYKLVKHLIRV